MFIDGLIDSKSINDSVLGPLLLKNSIRMNPPLQPTVHPKKFDLKNFLLKNLIAQNTLKTENNFEKAFENVNAGFCALFVDTLDIAICIEAKDIKGRNVTEPQSENVVRGPHEGFIENIRTNTSLLRKIINNENLVIESTSVRRNNKNICCNLLYEKYSK